MFKENKSKKNKSKASLKTEGTSKTFGQLVSFSSISQSANQSKKNNSTSTTNVSVSVSSKGKSKNKGGISDSTQDLDKFKASIALAAASSKSSSTDSTFVIDKGIISGESLSTISGKVSVFVVDSGAITKEQIFEILKQSQKTDLFITLKSQDSVSLEYNNLQDPIMESKFIYNFWDKNESDISSQEDPSQDPLATQNLKDVPRYVEIRWESISVIEQITENIMPDDKETEGLREEVFASPRGVSNLNNTTNQNQPNLFLKNLNLRKVGHGKSKTTDIHNLEKGFGAASNNKNNFIRISAESKEEQVLDPSKILNILSARK